MRFTEYVTRFVRLAARYEEEIQGSTKLNYPSYSFNGEVLKLGSGMCFPDEATAARELAANTSRIEGWRRTNSYKFCVIVCADAEFYQMGADREGRIFPRRRPQTLSKASM
jgi:hypothetical protein